MSTLVLSLAIVALLAVGGLYLWRRRQPVAAIAARPRAMERTLYATTYEQLGISPPEPEPDSDDATTCMSLEELGLDEPEEGTALVDMQALHRTPEPPRPVMSSDLVFHFELAVNAYAQWRGAMAGPRDLDAIVRGPEHSWRDALAMLVSQLTAADCEPLFATLRAPPSPEARAVAALTLLEHREADTLALLTELLPEREGERGEILDALALWRGPSAEPSLSRAAAMCFPHRGVAWASLLRRRALDPGPELIARYLDAPTPELVRAGYELLAVHAERRYCWSAVVARVHERDPQVQAAAITAGLRLDVDIAWAQCRELALRPDRPRACQLLASLGSLSEQRRLIEWAARPDAPAHALWCAALTGRAEAIELALARLDVSPREAQACLTHLCGNPNADLDWWALSKEQFWVDRRWLAGENYDTRAVRAAIASLDHPHRSALALELGIRCAELSTVRSEGYAQELLDDLAALDVVEIDFERSFPWSTN